MNKHDFIHGVLVGLAGTLSAVILLQMTGTHIFSVGDGVLSHGKYVKKLEYLEALIQESFLGDIEEEQLAEGLYAGLVAGLKDPYSYYYTPEEYEEENTYTEGAYVGIGVTMQIHENGGAEIVDCYAGSPGEEAGLETGDLVVAVDGTDVTEMEIGDIASMIRNSKTKKVTLTIYKKEASDSQDLTVELSDVVLPAIDYEMLEEQVGYIKILQFSGVAPKQYREAFEDLKKQGMKRLLVDLRDNPGGLLNSVCEILEEILPEGLIVYMEDKNGRREEEWCEGKHPLDMPLVVLQNGSSASASEIFAGAVKDYKIGTLVGTKTYGKGVVQSLQQLPDGSALKLTMANYYTPNGNNIHKIGVEPDVEVKLDESLLNRSDYSHEEDNQLQEALRIVLDKETESY